MLIDFSIFMILCAGIMNGSFVLPLRYIKGVSTENKWFFHSLIGMVIIPWAVVFAFFPGFFSEYSFVGIQDIYYLVFGGFFFGLGQLCFAFAIEKIGVALAFAVNLGLASAIGSVYVVCVRGLLFAYSGYVVFFAVILIIFSLYLFYKSSNFSEDFTRKLYCIGWLLALLAGVTSGLQNAIFVKVAFDTASKITLTHSFLVWPIFLSAASGPMMLGFFLKSRNKLKLCAEVKKFSVIARVFLTGVLFVGSLVLYSNAMGSLSFGRQIVGWPLFMVAIIFTSQVWGYICKCESKYNVYLNSAGLSLLVLSVVILSVAL